MDNNKNNIYEFLEKEIYKLSKVDTINPDDDLEDYGFDSITYTELINAFNSEFDTDFIPTIFFEFENTTLSSVTNYIYNSMDNNYEEENAFFEKRASIDENINIDDSIGVEGYIDVDKSSEDNIETKENIGVETEDEKVQCSNTIDEMDIAIIGMDGQFPGSSSLDEFWENISNHKNLISEIPQNRFDYKEFDNPEIQWGGFMDDVASFDAEFFNIPEKEAMYMDPQHRIFIKSVWKTLGDAGYTPNSISGGKVGVFAGIGSQDYSELINRKIDKKNPPPFALTGITSFMMVNRISSMLNINGPSEPVDTACSSSLVAINRAIKSMKNKECDMAIVGGVNIIATPSIYHSFSSANMLNNKPECKVFDNESNGTLRGEGVGTLLLKPAKFAVRDNDNIHAIIKSSTVNHKGSTSSLTAINKTAISNLLEEAYSNIDIKLEDIDYIESHSTGSKLGDPIEIQAIQELLLKRKEKYKDKLFIGSLKSNVGHMEAASGIGSLIKTILSIKNKTLVGINGLNKINSFIRIDDSPIKLSKKNQFWDRKEEFIPRRAAVNTFGFGGVNAHLVIEEYIDQKEKTHTYGNGKNLFILSDKSKESLKNQADKYIDFITQNNFVDEDVNDICFTLQNGREEQPYRLAFVVEKIEDIIEKLKLYTSDSYNKELISVGNLDDENYFNISKVLLNEPEINELLKRWVQEGKLLLIQKLWTNGLDIPWNYIYINKHPQKISLPNYTFDEKRYWITDEDEDYADYNEVEEEDKAPKKSQILLPNFREDIFSNLKKDIILVIQEYLPKGKEIDETISFSNLGVDSIILIQVVKKIQSYNITVDFEDLYNTENIKDIIDKLENKIIDKTELPQNESSFLELIKLNNVTHGKPVFWIHGGFGGVEVYRFIAKHIKRPFYGIQAPGYMTNKESINKVEELAKYYFEIIKNQQLEDGFDIGGLSFGGVIAYELARQMQQKGYKVNSLVMLESLFVEEDMRQDWKTINSDNIKKDRIFRIVNLLLSFMNSGKEVELIKDEEVYIEKDFETFVNELIELSIRKGINKSKEQLKKTVDKLYSVLTGLDEASTFYIPKELPNKIDNAVFVANSEDTLFGKDEEFFRLIDKGRIFDFYKSHKQWKNLIPNLEMIETNSSSHLTLITDELSLSKIINTCEKIY